MKMYGTGGKQIWVRLKNGEEVGPIKFNEADMYDGPQGEMRLLVVGGTDRGTLYFVLRNVIWWRVK